jgi:hypothetical protein
MKPLPTRSSSSVDDAATVAAIATWPGDRPGLLRLLQCRLWHRADWQYLETRQSTPTSPWPVDQYRCDRCERAWERLT